MSVFVDKRDRVRVPLFLAVILAAITLHEPWMIALQAALGGFMLGAWVERRWPTRQVTK